jgi:DNA-binding transcriptional LysR family regulator
MRTLGRSHRILVAAPQFLPACAGKEIEALTCLPTLSSTDEAGEIDWALFNAHGAERRIRHEPRLSCGDFLVVREAAIAGLGVALLPDHSCSADLAAGRLVQPFPTWRSQAGIVHLVFTTRHGLPPAVRAFIDHLAQSLRLEC